MKIYSARCPDCSFLNHGLYLEETGGWFECEFCGNLVYAGNDVEVNVESETVKPGPSDSRAALFLKAASARAAG